MVLMSWSLEVGMRQIDVIEERMEGGWKVKFKQEEDERNASYIRDAVLSDVR